MLRILFLLVSGAPGRRVQQALVPRPILPGPDQRARRLLVYVRGAYPYPSNPHGGVGEGRLLVSELKVEESHMQGVAEWIDATAAA